MRIPEAAERAGKLINKIYTILLIKMYRILESTHVIFLLRVNEQSEESSHL